MIFILYINDILIVGSRMVDLSTLKSKMAKVFDIKDTKETSHILKIRIDCDRFKKRLCLSQEEYIDKMLQCLNMDKGKASMTYNTIAVICESNQT